MKRPLRMLAFSTALILAFTIGYIVGSIRAARLENLNGQIDSMTLALGVADAMRTGKSNIIYPDSHGIVSSTYQGVTNEPWLRKKLLIPVVEWDPASAFPDVSFGVSDAGRSLTAKAGQFLRETENQSNRLASTNRASP
jgi:hypothetical protein